VRGRQRAKGPRPSPAELSDEQRATAVLQLSLKFTFSPMRVLVRRIKLALDVSVQCSQHANARHHGRAVELDDQEQRFYRGLPLLDILLGLGKLLDILGSVLEGDELTAAGQGNGIVEGAGPGHQLDERGTRTAPLPANVRASCSAVPQRRRAVRGPLTSLFLNEVVSPRARMRKVVSVFQRIMQPAVTIC